MSAGEILLRLNGLKTQTFTKDGVNNSAIEEIQFILQQVPNENKSAYKKFVNEFYEHCFANGIELNRINLKDFDQDQVAKDDIDTEKEVYIENVEIAKAYIDFDELLQNLIMHMEDYFETYKGYFITKLENDPSKATKILFLYENTYHYVPIRNKIRSHFSDVLFKEIHEFKDDTGDNNYLCVFLLMSKMNDSEGLRTLRTSIKTIIDNFKAFNSYSLLKTEEKPTFKFSNEKKKFLDDVEIVMSTYLSNAKIHSEEQKIIKRLCESFQTPLIFYRTLKEGFSGAKVLEVRPKKSFDFQNENRYIVKYGVLDDDEKLKKEYINFSKYIAGYKNVGSYTAHYKDTLTHEAILYNYAISEQSKESYSFSEVLEKKDNKYHDNTATIIDKLFKCGLISHWSSNDFKSEKKAKVSEIYGEYINIKKLTQVIKTIKNYTDEDVLKCPLIENFNKIWNVEIAYNEKVCHGDLHSDNFFVDENDIFLIDFGYTNLRHALIDYTSLECSIKFKHFPFYILTSELEDIERELLSSKTFDLSYTFSSTTRKEVLNLLNIINTIRNSANAELVSRQDQTEYLISLFIMTFRQILYSDLNQLYAYTSSCLLSDALIIRLGI